MSFTSHPPWFHLKNDIQCDIKIIKLFTKQYFPVSGCLFSLGTLSSNTLRQSSSLNVKDQGSHPHRTRYSVSYYRYSALGPVRAETRGHSGNWYGSGTLHPGQILRGSLPLLSPAFRRAHFRHQLSPRPPRRERSPAAEGGTVGENIVQ
jgi:hypothetical protein